MNSEKVFSDRFLLSLLFAAVAHAVLILGVSFEIPKEPEANKSLTIALVRNPSQKAPEKADFLAPENQFGSGTHTEKAIPRSDPTPQEGQGRQAENSPSPAPVQEAKLKRVLKQQTSEKKIVMDRGTEVQPNPQPVKLTAAALSQQIAELSAELNKSREEYARRPRLVYINSVNAHKYKAAAYEKAWQEKIERIGNLNYPDEARRRKLSGSLLLSVGIKPDGTVYSVQIRHSSGHQVLDDAAMNIVQLAAPFAPFPQELRQQADVLVITRTWRFEDNHRLETGP
ncbi:energy transducer TonB [Methylocaldum szegediense]|uniref:Periplasmic protein TonB n=1 Tax=Methylocaldum szegediense TaxID=73780 RepID=A0ABN8X7T0_9GAMM|nr:energy transducer TonB [Methylocaldum szegediense]CAI8882555.1 periplasmic protein TonB [Methylocaldum szegediense]